MAVGVYPYKIRVRKYDKLGMINMFRTGIVVLLVGIIGALLTTFIYNDFPNVEYVQVASFILGVTGITMMESKKRKEDANKRGKRK